MANVDLVFTYRGEMVGDPSIREVVVAMYEGDEPVELSTLFKEELERVGLEPTVGADKIAKALKVRGFSTHTDQKYVQWLITNKQIRAISDPESMTPYI